MAIGRALAASPRLMLMDEPLASLDEARKAEILPYIERLRDEAGIPIVYVSHAIAEVARLATDVVVLVRRPRRRQRAGGRRCWPASTSPRRRSATRPRRWSTPSSRARTRPSRSACCARPAASGGCRGSTRPLGSRLRARIRARDVMLALDRPERISALNVLPATVRSVTEAPGAADALVHLDAGGDRLLARVTRQTVVGAGARARHAALGDRQGRQLRPRQRPRPDSRVSHCTRATASRLKSGEATVSSSS